MLPFQSSSRDVDASVLRGLSVVFLLTGLAWRLLRYGLRFPIWGDEAFVCLNLLDQTYAGLTGPLECGQVAPLLFLWGELAVYNLLGGSELAVRLLPLLAGLGALPLFARLAQRLLPPLAATLSIGFLATAYWPVAMSSTVKPYALDLFMGLLLLVLAAEWLSARDQWGWLAGLCVACPLAVFSSYPAVCVAGGVSLALLPSIWRRAGVRDRALFAVFNIGLVAAFAVHFGLIACRQLGQDSGRLEAYLQHYWADGFPPADLGGVPEWLLQIHTGRMCAYPIGASHGGSCVTTLLVGCGLFVLLRRSSPVQIRLLLLAPFALNFIAACLHKYPYGGCCRLSQHLAPAICLLAGSGLALLLEILVRPPALRLRWTAGLAGCLVLIAGVGMTRDLLWPYKDRELYEARARLQQLDAVQDTAPIVVTAPEQNVDPVHRWMLSQLGRPVIWNAADLRRSDPHWTVDFEKVPSADVEAETFGQFDLMRMQITRNRRPAEQSRSLSHTTSRNSPEQSAMRPGAATR